MGKKAANETKSTGLAVQSISGRAMSITLPGGKSFKVKRQVTLPLLKQKAGEAVYIKVDTRMVIGKQMPAKPNAKGEMVAPDPATVVNVVNLETGIVMQYLVPAVLRDTWETEYNGKITNPDATHDYVGKSFAILKMPADAGKRYNNIQITEIEEGDE